MHNQSSSASSTLFRLPSLFCLLAFIASASLHAAPTPIRVLLITGGCCHDYTEQKQLIKNGLESRAHMQVTVVEQGGRATDVKIPLYEDPNWASNYDIVIHDECFAEVKDSGWMQRILKPHQEGLPAVVIHCAMHCYRDGTDNWFKFCGVTSHGHGAHYGHEVLNRDGTHPIMKGWGAAWANPQGELYNIAKIWPTAHPLAAAKDRASGREEVCVWTNQYGKARVFGTTLGHHNETVEHPRFLDMLTRGTLWACDKLTDDYLKPVQSAPKKLVPVNLAKGKPATASSVQPGNEIRFATDGNPSSRWCASDSTAPQWLQIDLGNRQNVTGCELMWEHPSKAVYRYVIEGSTDGNQWNLLVDQSNNQTKRNHTHKFETKLRHMRVRFLGTDNGLWGSLWEVAIHGTEMQPVEQDTATERLAGLKLPDGFKATVFAAPPAVNYPTFVAAAPDGTVYVSVDKNGSIDREKKRGSIYRLRDLDGDGEADEVKLYVPDVDSPRGIVWDHDRLYVMHPPHLSAFIDRDGDGHSDEQKILVKNIAFGFEDRPADHTSNGVTLGIDGWLYLAIGDFGFMNAEGTDGRQLQFRSGGVVRVRPDGTDLQVYSRGTRNILEVAMDPLLNGFTRDNTNDGGGWDIRVHHFSGLEHHGYPSLYMNFTDEAVAPLADYGGGSGCGALYLDEPGFPDGFGNALYTADWGRSIVYRHHPTQNGATFSVDQDEFIHVPRVTDLDVDGNSSLYVSSWKGATFTYVGEEVGYLVKIQPTDYQPKPLPDFANASATELVELLNSPSHRRRLEAQRALIRLATNETGDGRGLDGNAIEALVALAGNDDKRLPSRVAAIFALKQSLGADALNPLMTLASSTPAVRAWAIRALSDRPTQIRKQANVSIIKGLTDTDPRVRLESVVAAARQSDLDLARFVTPLLVDSDPVIAHTAVQGLVKLKAVDALIATFDATESAAKHKQMALRALSSIHTEDTVNALIDRLGASKGGLRSSIATALCRLHFVEGEWKGNSWGTRPDTSGPYYQPETWAQSERIQRTLERELSQTKGEPTRELLHQLDRHKVRLPKALEFLLASATNDDSVLPLVIGALSREETIPTEGAALLTKLCEDPSVDLDLRVSAIEPLLRTDIENAWQTALETTGESAQKHGDDSEEVRKLSRVFLRSGQLKSNIVGLTDIATTQRGIESTLADAALLRLSKPEGKRKSKDKPGADKSVSKVDQSQTDALAAIESGWKVPTRRVQILRALAFTNARHLETKVRRALKDSDAAVVAAAEQVAKRWKLEPEPIPAGPQIKTLEIADVLTAVANASSNGGASKGEAVFGRLDCQKCHTVAPGEKLRGPYLPNVARTYKRDQLAEAILQPSKTLAQGFVTTRFFLRDGTSVNGFITEESAADVTYRDSEGKEHRLAVDAIEERATEKLSMMPAGLVDELTVDDFSALLTYLQSLAKVADEKPTAAQ